MKRRFSEKNNRSIYSFLFFSRTFSPFLLPFSFSPFIYFYLSSCLSFIFSLFLLLFCLFNFFLGVFLPYHPGEKKYSYFYYSKSVNTKKCYQNIKDQQTHTPSPTGVFFDHVTCLLLITCFILLHSPLIEYW